MAVLINRKDLKVKHASGEYPKLPSAPEADDIVYFMVQKKKKTTTIDELSEFFGEEKLPKIYDSLDWLEGSNHIKKIELELGDGEEIEEPTIGFELIKDGTVS